VAPSTAARAVQCLTVRAACMVVVSRPPMEQGGWRAHLGGPCQVCTHPRSNPVGAPRALMVAVITGRAIPDPAQVAGRSA
jgi:hypothetical protein